MTIASAVGASLLYSAVFYAKKRARSGEPFNAKKMGATLLVGLGVGLAAAYAGDPLSQTSLEARLAALTGVVALLESLLKIATVELRRSSSQ